MTSKRPASSSRRPAAARTGRARKSFPGARASVSGGSGSSRTTGARTVAPRTRRPVSPRRPVGPRTVRDTHRLALPGAMIVALAMVMVVRLVWIGAVDAEVYSQKGKEKFERQTVLKELRGTIFDRNGEALVMDIPTRTLAADPTMIANPEAVAAVVAEVVGLDPVAVQNALSKPDTEYSVIERHVDLEIAAQLQDRVAAMRKEAAAIEDPAQRKAAQESLRDYNGLIYDPDQIRHATNGNLARSVIGSLDPFGQEARSGVEKLYDDDMSATDGVERVERGRNGINVPGTERVLRQARAGADVTLTLDRALQFYSEAALAAQVAAVNAKGGTVVLGRPDTGEILAMASVSRTETGDVVQGSLNQAIRLYEPGSVMKVATIAAAYDLGLMTPETTFEVPDSIKLYDKTINDSHKHETETMTTKRILAESSNVGTIKIAQAVAAHGGNEEIVKYLHSFGFGSYTALGLPKEQAGEVKPAETWNGSDIGSIPIGQSITVTPLQMWGAYNAIANDGVYVAPKLVRSIVDAEGQSIPLDTVESHRVVSVGAANMVTAGLKDVVEDGGTGSKFKIDGLEIAAKTGTAYKVQNGTYGTAATRTYAASFVGFFPADRPEITIMVMIDEPGRGQHFGATAAGPVFQALTKEVMRRFSISTSALASDSSAPVRAQAAPAPTTAPPTTIAPTTIPGEETAAPAVATTPATDPAAMSGGPTVPEVSDG